MEKDTQKALEQAKQEVSVVAEGSSGVVVNSEPTLVKANDWLGRIKIAKKVVKERKDFVLVPARQTVDNIRALFAPVEEEIDEVEGKLKEQVLAYNRKLEEETKKREKEAQEKIEKGEDVEEATKSLEKIQEKKSNIKNVRKIKKLKIVDVNKIPREFMIPDEVKIRQALLSGAKVEGAEMYEEEILAN